MVVKTIHNTGKHVKWEIKVPDLILILRVFQK